MRLLPEPVRYYLAMRRFKRCRDEVIKRATGNAMEAWIQGYNAGVKRGQGLS